MPTLKEIFWHAIALNQNFKTRALPQVNSPVVAVTALVHKCDGVSFVGEHTGFWFARIQRRCLIGGSDACYAGGHDAVANGGRTLHVVIDSAFAR